MHAHEWDEQTIVPATILMVPETKLTCLHEACSQRTTKILQQCLSPDDVVLTDGQPGHELLIRALRNGGINVITFSVQWRSHDTNAERWACACEMGNSPAFCWRAGYRALDILMEEWSPEFAIVVGCILHHEADARTIPLYNKAFNPMVRMHLPLDYWYVDQRNGKLAHVTLPDHTHVRFCTGAADRNVEGPTLRLDGATQ